MRQLQFSLNALIAGIAGVALLLAVPAYFIVRIRAEAKAGQRLEAATIADANQCGGGKLFGGMVSWRWPSSRLRQGLYRVAGSPGEFAAVDIIGETSAEVLAMEVSAFSHVRNVRILACDHGSIAQKQIDSVSHLGSLDRLDIAGNLAPPVQLRSLARISSIGWLHLRSNALSESQIEELGSLHADWLTVYCESEDSSSLASEAFASFRSATFKRIEIWAFIDDRALELIATAPQLDELVIHGLLPDGIGPRITDEGVRKASRNLHVRSLTVDSTGTTDSCIDAVATIKELRRLSITGVTDAGARRLHDLRPDVDM